MLRRRQQALEHARLEQGVAVQDQKLLLHLAPRDPAAHQIVGGGEERVVKRADFLRRGQFGETGLDRFGAVADDHRDIANAASHQGVESAMRSAGARAPEACISGRARSAAAICGPGPRSR